MAYYVNKWKSDQISISVIINKKSAGICRVLLVANWSCMGEWKLYVEPLYLKFWFSNVDMNINVQSESLHVYE